MKQLLYVILLIPFFGFTQYSNLDINTTKTIPSLSIGTTFCIGGSVLGYHIKPFTAEEISLLKRNDLDILDRTATYNYSIKSKKTSDIMLVSSIMLPLAVLSNSNAQMNIDKLALITAETYLFTLGTTMLTKSLVKRTRPFVYNENAPMSEKMLKDARMSFYSGHTSFTAASSFYTASMLNLNSENKNIMPYIWTSAALFPAITGYMRWKAGKHFPTDIFIGYMVGLGIGILMPQVH